MGCFPEESRLSLVGTDSIQPTVLCTSVNTAHVPFRAQWSLSLRDTLNKGHLSNEDTVCSPNHIVLCKNPASEFGHISMQDSQLGPSGVHYREAHCMQDSQLGPSGAHY